MVRDSYVHTYPKEYSPVFTHHILVLNITPPFPFLIYVYQVYDSYSPVFTHYILALNITFPLLIYTYMLRGGGDSIRNPR